MALPYEGIDWTRFGRLFSEQSARLMHEEGTELHGDEFYGEVLRRVWERIGHNWVTDEEHMRVLDMNRKQDRANGEAAEARLEVLGRTYAEKMANSAREYAAALRARCNDRTVPSRLRREGVEIAAGWLEGKP